MTKYLDRDFKDLRVGDMILRREREHIIIEGPHKIGEDFYKVRSTRVDGKGNLTSMANGSVRCRVKKK